MEKLIKIVWRREILGKSWNSATLEITFRYIAEWLRVLLWAPPRDVTDSRIPQIQIFIREDFSQIFLQNFFLYFCE